MEFGEKRDRVRTVSSLSAKEEATRDLAKEKSVREAASLKKEKYPLFSRTNRPVVL